MGDEKKPVVAIVGSANVDIFFKTERLPFPGETVVASAFYKSYGGKGANQAVAVAKLGGRAIMVCKLGGDEGGRELFDNFCRAGVETSWIVKDPETSSGMAFITVDRKGENSIVLYTGANMKFGSSDVERAIEGIKEADIVVTQLEIPISTVRRTGEIAKELNLPFVLNPAPASKEDISNILGIVDVLCPNRAEAQALTGEKIESIDDARKVGRKLLSLGPRCVVLTLGSWGALLCTQDYEELFPAPDVEVVDTTGAGDAFVGALAFALARGSSKAEAVRFATLAAAISVTKDGTQAGLPTLEEVVALERRISG
ncbi:MAG: ribokinase [Spirochaetota bacterium]